MEKDHTKENGIQKEDVKSVRMNWIKRLGSQLKNKTIKIKDSYGRTED